MDTTQKLDFVESVLTRAAEDIGDITGPVLARFCARHPGGETILAQHNRPAEELAGLMVEQSLYCLMRWFSSPIEIEILLADTVPHHEKTLDISRKAYSDFLAATAEIIGGSIPESNADELAVWEELSSQLAAAVESCD